MSRACLVVIFIAGLFSMGCDKVASPSRATSSPAAEKASPHHLGQPNAVIELSNTTRKSKTKWIARDHPRESVSFTHSTMGSNEVTDCTIAWEYVSTWNSRDVYVFTIGDPSVEDPTPLEIPVLTGQNTVTVYETPRLKLVIHPQ